jgi:hypothetical protein
MTTTMFLEPPVTVFSAMPTETRQTLGEQQTKMALAALIPPPARLQAEAPMGPWVVKPAKSQEIAGSDELSTAPRARHMERILRCPYCRSATYEVWVSVEASGMAARGTCSLCGTRGASFRPLRMSGHRKPRRPGMA